MELSEAIRLGAMLRPQGFNTLRRGGASCALGAAYEAAGIYPAGARAVSITAVVLCFPIMVDGAVCPVCYLSGDVGDVVTHLNDDHHWTREAIADFVTTIEPAQARSVAVGERPTAHCPSPRA